MARHARIISRRQILMLLQELKQEFDFSIIVYCVMNNHLHLLARINDDDLKVIMKKLNVKFALYYNRIEERYGYVF